MTLDEIILEDNSFLYTPRYLDLVENTQSLVPLRSTQCTVRVEKTQTRNERCECGSGLKFKKCCINKKTDSI